MGRLYAENLSTDFGTPPDLNPNDWPVVDGWHVQPSSGVHIKWLAGHDLYIARGGTATIGDWVDVGAPSYIGSGARLGAGSVWISDEAYLTHVGDGTIIGEDCRFGTVSARIGDHVTIGDRVTVGDGYNIDDGSRIASDWTIGKRCNITGGTVIG
jgi:UDP-3-O-[3-hydroxymyristoyl] glucosamine N-acyltransferase